MQKHLRKRSADLRGRHRQHPCGDRVQEAEGSPNSGSAGETSTTFSGGLSGLPSASAGRGAGGYLGEELGGGPVHPGQACT